MTSAASFLLRNPRRKGEDLRTFVTRVIIEAKSDLPGVREDLIDEALRFYRSRIVENVEDQAEDKAGSEVRRLEAAMAELTAKHEALTKAHAKLLNSMPASISIREAEEGALASFKLAREKAALLMENEGGVPTAMSEAIRDIPDPKPRWSK